MEKMVSQSSQGLSLPTRVRLYFTDLSFYTRTTFGPDAATKRQLWLVGCYLSFALGLFCRQITDLSKLPNVNLDLSRLKLSVLAGSFIVGLAIFPLVVRLVRRLADYVASEDKKGAKRKSGRATSAEASGREGWNVIHLFTSFTTGFFVNLAYEQVVELIRTKIH